ncbi:DUF6985 domain-containing protein [Priestia megaterium]|jgi:hypothetical protein|uniref:DUF6985 domain-containing protein n=1 Tax=Priestia megaterium TaxID=1404 RepID=UPI000680D100|nr:hypothetical protein [Priestia megaterium]KNH23668.1 hypothetical protein ACS78_08685 [Priestia megaterium]MBE2975698.1 hypothetical protein [Priestia megaterium]MBU8686662.1 hypothetical protein [Priestia megaterium]MDH3143849.1 hypothetical protein [Priestia megaterium]MDI3092606.1 hypothetical protein [Priestia megaterium]
MNQTLRVHHPLFGSLLYDSAWVGEKQVTFFGQKQHVLLTIDGDKEKPFQKRQEEAFQAFWLQGELLLKRTEKALFDYYQQVRDEYRTQVEKDVVDLLVPNVKKRKDIGFLVECIQIFVPEAPHDTRELGLFFECTWEEEHMLAVKFRNEQISAIGLQEDLF